MTPSARVQAAIEILDDILDGSPAEKALTGWARRSRFAGSKDRAAVRDHVFDALRCRRSFAARGGSENGRGLMIGAIRSLGADPNELFTGDRHAPDPLEESEVGRDFVTESERFDVPEWLWPEFQRSLGDEAQAAATALQSRAPLHLRVNLQKVNRQQAAQELMREGISTEVHPACETALEVKEGARKVAQSHAYLSGLVELQDAASQAVVAALPLRPGMRIIDYCAGGGGKALAIAALSNSVKIFAHDANPARMHDLPARAQRAGAEIKILSTEEVFAHPGFDIILIDAPCSGSGSWRRAPAGKWALTPDRLSKLVSAQMKILGSTAPLVSPGGLLAYVTCSILSAENDSVVEGFLNNHPGWQSDWRKQWMVSKRTDGFFSAHLTRS
ncbi:RsmB/NOP family class I SAM-dependent RNA methyltransferase [Ruegeria arenilitoris]|uniref:RsmB/NOP family class I SAM-dependent RNA methyltransferase n=1 Tax=Ruegeria arenilitoris TaxID=1173585 RepID=UPI00147F9FAD|nr:RsmB/NOP family class I SAM-dependent RNA methyltransferase [Ruegeria arenilitoris]